jgi:hypothetical protein
MDLSPEVLIYIQSVKNFLNSDENTKNYFINGDETFFYHHLSEIAQKNFETNGEPRLTINQFELLRKTMYIIYNVMEKDFSKNPEENLFIDYQQFGKFCLN